MRAAAGTQITHITDSSTAPGGKRRQQFILLAAAGLCQGLPPAGAAQAGSQRIQTFCFTDPGGLFQLSVPLGWQQVTVLPGSGVLASFYDPARRGAHTVAVYEAVTAASSTEELGLPQAVGEALAAVSPGGQLQWCGSSVRAGGRRYTTTQVLFTGISAAHFGAVLDVRCSTVARGRKYTVRVTSLCTMQSGLPA